MRFFWKLMSVTLAGTLLASCASETSDFIPEPGNQGGDEGGTVVAAGTPEEVAACPASYTGQYLKPLLSSGAVDGKQH